MDTQTENCDIFVGLWQADAQHEDSDKLFS